MIHTLNEISLDQNNVELRPLKCLLCLYSSEVGCCKSEANPPITPSLTSQLTPLLPWEPEDAWDVLICFKCRFYYFSSIVKPTSKETDDFHWKVSLLQFPREGGMVYRVAREAPGSARQEAGRESWGRDFIMVSKQGRVAGLGLALGLRGFP